MTSPVLAATGVSMQFGGLRALNDVSFALTEGEIIGLIGPNGAGKTTLFNCLTGQYTPTAGTISRSGRPLPEDPARVTEEGVARTFQNIRLFPSMTASENVLVGRHVRMKQNPFSSLLHGPGYRKSEAEAAGRTEELLEFVGLTRFADELARNLPYGDQRRLEIARALATEPKVLLLDEPTAGMAPAERGALMALTERIARARGLTVLFTEHDMDVVFAVADRIMVLHQGRVIAEGRPAEVRADAQVQRVYLGEEA
jgi:branched-chain amino acid transport system ATP-binding protein